MPLIEVKLYDRRVSPEASEKMIKELTDGLCRAIGEEVRELGAPLSLNQTLGYLPDEGFTNIHTNSSDITAYANTGMTNQNKIEEVLKKILAGGQGAAPFIVQ